MGFTMKYGIYNEVKWDLQWSERNKWIIRGKLNEKS